MKKLISVLLFFIVLITVRQSVFAFQNEPDNFRGIKWGTNIKSLYGMKLCEKSTVTWYKKEYDKLKIGDAQLENVLYGFYNEQFFTVMIIFSGYTNYNMIRNTLFNQYGNAFRENQNVENDLWSGIYVTIFMEYNSILEKGSITYFYQPLLDKYNAEQQRNAKKGADDL